MMNENKKILTLDTELSCWENRVFHRKQVKELFQFGLALIDVDTLTIERSGCYFIKNERHEVTTFCTELTGITQRQLTRQGLTLEHARQVMSDKWGIGNRATPLVAWGDESKWMRGDYLEKGLEYPFHNGLINLADYHQFGHKKSRKRPGLKKTCNYYGVKMHEPHHNAESDAISLANLLIEMIKRGHIWPTLDKN
jgi:inhibitor of KinA sporulation pathway (predicted exonuclease)